MILLRRLRAFGSDLLLIPTMWRYLVAVARQDRATEKTLKKYREGIHKPSAGIERTTLGFSSLSREVRGP